MKEALIVLLLLGISVAGYFVMKKLDTFLDENRKMISKEEENKEPDCVMLTEDMSDEELLKEIHNFRGKNSRGKIFLYKEDEKNSFENR